MKQQINLYQAQFQEKKVALPAAQISLILCGLLMVMILSSLTLAWVNHGQAAEKARLQARLDILKNENKTMLTRLEQQKVDPALETAVDNAAKQLRSRKRIMQWVNESQSDSAIRFSELLTGLGRQHIAGLWLSHIDIFNGGKDLGLRGSATSPELLPDFIGRLGKESAYTGREFKRVGMQEREAGSGIIDFVLTTEKHSEKDLQMVSRVMRSASQ